MNSRDAILHRIRTALASQPAPERPPVPEVWPDTQPTVETMAERFTLELQAVGGQVVRCTGMDEARQRLGQLLDELQGTPVGILERPLCRELTSLCPERVLVPPADATARGLADLKVSLLSAECLLADSGSGMIACGTAQERLLCYLPPACIVVAKVDQLAEHLQAAWPQIAPRIAEPDRRGEFVFVTGPSRTADIEKILILGVHGPKRLIVLLVG